MQPVFLECFMKLLFLKSGFLVLVVLFAQNVIAQEEAPKNIDLLSYYNTELFQWSYDFWGGKSLNYQNQSSTTMAGLKDSMEKALSAYEDTNKKFLSYKNKTLVGHILFWTGYTAVLTSPFIAAYGPRDGDALTPDTFGATMGVMGGGLAVLTAGAILWDLGQEDIFDAVNLYNRTKIAEYGNN